MTAADPSDFDEDDAPELDMRDLDIEQLENLQAMGMAFATWLHQKGAAEMEKSGETSAAEIRQLSHSFNRAARAIRQIVVIKHEVAELRPMPGSRPVAAPANQNARYSDLDHRTAAKFRRQRERSDLNDLSDEQRREAKATMDAYLHVLLGALQADIEASGRPDIAAEAAKESNAVKLTTIAAQIPHPTLDAAISQMQMKKLWDIFAPKFVKNRDRGPPPLGGWPDEVSKPPPPSQASLP